MSGWHVVFDLSTGEARSICTTDALPSDAELAALGLGRFDAPAGVDARVCPWDAATRTLGPPPVPPLHVDPADLIDAFTPAEWYALKESTEPVVQHYYDQITGRLTPINVRSQRIAGGLQFLAARGLLAAHRPDEIMAKLMQVGA